MALFLVLFFHSGTPEIFSREEIFYTLLWRIPACFLVLLLIKKPPVFSLKRTLVSLAIAFPALCLLGFLVSFAAVKTGLPLPHSVNSPNDIEQWSAAISLSLGAGFLEEAYFRVYLPLRILAFFKNSIEKNKIDLGSQWSSCLWGTYLFSALVFAVCHSHNGFWGFAYAFLAAIILSFTYIKYSSFFGIALAHGFYNTFVFIIAYFI